MFNPLVPDAHYESQDKPVSLQIQQLEVDLKLNCGFFLHPENYSGLILLFIVRMVRK